MEEESASAGSKAAAAKAAEAVQRALIGVALQAYEEAGLSGLCAEGRWEVALGAMRTFDPHAVLDDE